MLGAEPRPLALVPPEIGAALDRVLLKLVGDRITAAALCLTVVGWAAMWARALGVIGGIPPWAAALVFLLGLALIPFRVAEGPERG